MNTRVTSKKLPAMVLAAGLLFSLACGAKEEATPTAPAPTPTTAVALPARTPTPTPSTAPGEKPVYGGTAIFAKGVNEQSWDNTHLGGGLQPANGIGPIVWSALIRESLTDRVSLEGDLAESWTVSQDGLTWKFKLRSGIVQHDGTPFGVNELEYNLYRMVDRPNKSPYTQGGGCMKTAIKEPARQGGVEITGPNEITIRLKGPSPWFASCVSSGYVMFGPANKYKAIDDTGKWRILDYEKGEVVGTGPFKAVDMIHQSREIYERHPKYFKPGLPYLDRVEIFHSPDRAPRLAAMLAGKNDGFLGECCDGFRSDMTPIKKALGDKVVMPQSVGYGLAGIMVNLRRAPFGPLEDPKARTIRKALQLWYDRDESGQAGYEGMYMKPYYYYPGCAGCALPGFDWIYTVEEWEKLPGFNPKTKAQDIAEARRLMESIGYGPNNLLTFDFAVTASGSARRQADVAVAKMKEIHMAPKVRVSQLGQSEMEQATTDMVTFVRGMGLLDPQQYDDQVYLPYEIYQNSNWTSWRNPEYERLHALAAATNDQKERGRLYREIVKILHEDAWVLSSSRARPLHPFNGAWRGWTPKVRHVQNESLENVWISPTGKATPEMLQKWDVYTKDPASFPIK